MPPSRRIARVGWGRLGYMRLGYYQPWVKVFIDGNDRSGGGTGTGPRTHKNTVTITQILNHELDTCSMRVSGFVPSKGEQVQVFVGDTSLEQQVFGGRILDVQQTYEHLKGSKLVVYDLNCVDFSWLLNRRKVTKRYTNQSATDIAIDLMTTYSGGFTSVHVAPALATIDEITYTNEDLTDALTRLSERIGGYWYLDYGGDLHFFTSENIDAGPITASVPRTMSHIEQSDDLSQVATRILGRGGGSTAFSDVDAGTTTLPIEDPGWYSGSGGSVQSGPQTITYTGVVTGGGGSNSGIVLPPVATFTVQANAVPGSMDLSATYGYAITHVTEVGETTPSNVVSGLSGASGSLDLLDVPAAPDDEAIIDRNLYRTEGGGAVLKLRSAGIGLAADAVSPDSASDASLGATAPTENTAGFSLAEIAAGATSIDVEDTTPFSSSGGWIIVPGGQLVRYTGRSTSSGNGALTGIPASGTGSIAAPFRAGVISVAPHLTGIPASGAGSIAYAIQKGDPVDIFVERNDTTAQSNLAAIIDGDDGIHEGFFQDGTLGLTELTARADATLTERKDPLKTIRLETRDPTHHPGRIISITLSEPSISGSFKIQRVIITELGVDGGAVATAHVFPKREVEASSKHFSFEDLLRQIPRRVA